MTSSAKIVLHSYESGMIRRCRMRVGRGLGDQAERKRGSWPRILWPKGARVCSTSRPRYLLWTSLAKANRRTCSQAVWRPNRALSWICHRVSFGCAWRSWRISIRRWLATPLNTLSNCRRINGSIQDITGKTVKGCGEKSSYFHKNVGQSNFPRNVG